MKTTLTKYYYVLCKIEDLFQQRKYSQSIFTYFPFHLRKYNYCYISIKKTI